MFVLNIIGDIDDKAVERFIEDIKLWNGIDDILIQFDSIGGYVDSGFALMDIILSLRERVNIVATNIGNVMSAATIPYVACNYRIFDITKGNFLIHQATLEGVEGNSDKLFEAAISTMNTDEGIAEFYSAVTGIDKDIYLERMQLDTPLTKEEMIKLKLVDEIIE